MKMPFQAFRLETAWKKREMGFELLFVVAGTEFFLDVFDGVANGRETFGIIIWDLGVEGVFKSHDQFDDVEGVCAQVFNELRFGFHLFFLALELFDDNFNDAFTIL